MQHRKSFLIPIESQARELDAKLLLALTAYERGWRPIFGYKTLVRTRSRLFPPGVFLSHNARYGREGFFHRIKRYGYESAVLDEEALVRQTDDIFLKKHGKEAFKDVHRLLTWGEDDAALWRRSGQIEESRIVVTGNPRTDLLRPGVKSIFQPEVDSILHRYGPYVLLNTNFPTVNHIVAKSETVRLADWVDDQGTLNDRNELLAHKRGLFDNFLSTVPQIAKAVAPLTLIVRTHPSEDQQSWIRAAEGQQNVRVIHEGGVVPWLIGAHLLIQNGCTSAVEAALLGTPVVTYRPIVSEKFDNPLPNTLGQQCFTAEAMLDAVRNRIGNPSSTLSESQRALLHRHVCWHEKKLSCELILDAFDHVLNGVPAFSIQGLKLQYHKLALWFSTLKKSIEDRNASSQTQKQDYVLHKFPTLTAEALNERVVLFQNALGRFKGFKAIQIEENLFEIRSSI